MRIILKLILKRVNSAVFPTAGKQLESISKTTSVGGNVRALVKGGWGFVSFNDLTGLQEKVEMAVNRQRFIGKETSQFYESKPVVEEVKAKIKENPALIPLSEKKQLLDEYNDVHLEHFRNPDLEPRLRRCQ